MNTPLASPYREAFARLRRGGRGLPLRERMSELLAILDLATTLASGPPNEETLLAGLRIVTRELRAVRGALFVRTEDGEWARRAAHDLPAGAPSTLSLAGPAREITAFDAGDEARDHHGLVLLCPVHSRGRPIALLGLGPREGDQEYGAEQRHFLRCAAACAASSIESELVHDELRRARRATSTGAFQLHNLLDIGRELSGDFEERALHDLVATSVMGHFLVARCALYLSGPRGLVLVHARGLRREAESAPIAAEGARDALAGLDRPTAVAELPKGQLRLRLEEARLALAVPLVSGTRVEGILGIGERASGQPFSREDRDFAETLARQALAALDKVRLHRVREEKLRQDRELQLAREIQHSLFPRLPPQLRGFEVAAESRPCYEVGGDSYDWVSLQDGGLALAVADVSGKGTPASLLMASVHASFQALAGTAPPGTVVERLNRFLFANTQAGRFVTLFYAVLEAEPRRLAYVNAGHVPPFLVRRDGTPSRLCEGGPALGLLDAARYDVGEVTLEPGDVVAIVTDGVTEALSADDSEFGDERVVEALRASSGTRASGLVEGLVSAVDAWVGPAGLGDDLTALVLEAD